MSYDGGVFSRQGERSLGERSPPWRRWCASSSQQSESVDYRGLDDPEARVEKLVAAATGIRGPVILVGSSLGGHVSAAAAARVKPLGLFLLAPAFYMPGFESYTPQDTACPTVIVHGWRDDIVPVENSVRWAREHRAALHVLDSDHRLEDRIEAICALLKLFLAELASSEARQPR